MLHIVNKSPHERASLSSALAHARPGHAVLLIEDAVIAATTGSPAAAPEGVALYALGPDLQARGLAARVAPGVAVVDYAGFVELVAAHPRVQSWL